MDPSLKIRTKDDGGALLFESILHRSASSLACFVSPPTVIHECTNRGYRIFQERAGFPLRIAAGMTI
jgi:hypothetical protein